MHLLIRTDGRTERHIDMDPYDEQRSAFATMNRTCDLGREFLRRHCLSIETQRTAGDPGRFTLWIAEPTLHGDVGLRNIPAALLAAQWGVPARVLCGPVVVTSTGSVASALVEDMRWEYVETLVEDITRAIGGLPVKTCIADPAWPQALRLAAAVLRDAPRPDVKGLTGDAAVAYLLAELGVFGGGR